MLLLSPHRAVAADPTLDWRTLETDHFRVHYTQGGEAFARRTAAISEEAWARLTTFFGPGAGSDVVHIVCRNDVDGANGLTQTQPYDIITLFAFSPEADTDLARYDDWLRLLLYHELTHTVHLNHTGLLFDLLNGAFGKTYLPNHVLPQWFIEGLATYAESRFTGLGRVGSAGFEQYLRMAALEGTLPESIGQLTGNPMAPPGGMWAYVFGGDFITFIARRHGDARIADFIERYGRRLPGALNIAAREVFGEDFEALFAAWREDRLLRAQGVRGARMKAGLITGARLTHGGLSHHMPVWADDETLLYSTYDGWSRERFVRARLDGGVLVEEPLFDCDGGCSGAVLLPDVGAALEERSLLLSSSDWPSPHQLFRDLFRVDLNGVRRGKAARVRLTRGLRAREPDVDRAGAHAVFVGADWGQTALFELDLTSGARTARIPFSRELQLSHPRYLPDGRVVVSAQSPGGFRDLFIATADGQLERLTEDPVREVAATVAPDGHTVYFSADAEGVFDVFSLDLLSKERRRVTRVLGGAMNVSLSPNGSRAAYEGWHAQGGELYVLPLGTSTPAPAEPEPEPARYDPQPVPVVESSYQPFAAAWPRSWAPSLRSSNDVTFLGVLLQTADPVGNHAWSTSLDWNVTDMEVSVGAAYSYSGLWPRLSVNLARWPGTGYLFVADQLSEFHMENLYASLGADVALPDLLDFVTLSALVTGYWTWAPDRPTRDHDPGENTPFVSEDDARYGLRVSWSYGRTERYAYSISPELGINLGMAFDLYLAAFGNPSDTFTLTWNADVFVPLPYAHGHVLAWLYDGGVNGGNASDRGRFYAGGLPPQDLLTDLLNRGGLFGSFLRGFAPSAFSGEVKHVLTTEYRLPVWDVHRGISTLPVYVDRITGSVFSDMALLYDETPTAESFHASAGLELRVGATILYELPAVFRLGYARALTPPVFDQVYFALGGGF